MALTHKEQARRTIEGAIKLLDGGKGWVRGTLYRMKYTKDGPKEQYCILGALNAAGGEGPEVANLAREAVAKKIPKEHYTADSSMERQIAVYNDHRAKNAQEVIAILRKAARSLLRKITPKKKQKEKNSYFYSKKNQKEKAYIGG